MLTRFATRRVCGTRLFEPGSTRDSQVWTWKEVQNPDGILFSMLRETESMVQKILEVSQKRMPRENREYTRIVVQNMKDRLRHDESISEISMNFEKIAHFDMDAIHGFIDAGSIAHGPELRKDFEIVQEF